MVIGELANCLKKTVITSEGLPRDFGEKSILQILIDRVFRIVTSIHKNPYCR
jgi:hypothetical protein